MQQILSQSLNVGVSYIAQKVGSPKFSNYMKSFGLGEETGIDLPDDAVLTMTVSTNAPRDPKARRFVIDLRLNLHEGS